MVSSWVVSIDCEAVWDILTTKLKVFSFDLSA